MIGVNEEEEERRSTYMGANEGEPLLNPAAIYIQIQVSKLKDSETQSGGVKQEKQPRE